MVIVGGCTCNSPNCLRYAVGRGVEPFRVEFGKPICLISDEGQAAAMAEDWDEDIAIANEVK